MRVLVIEDDPASLELFGYLIEAVGHAVLRACDGEAGLALARAERPDLVVCDVQIPKLDGLGFIAAVRADPELRATPVIAVTALAMVGDKARILAAGFDGYVSKPIQPQSFVRELETLARYGRQPPAP